MAKNIIHYNPVHYNRGKNERFKLNVVLTIECNSKEVRRSQI